jgi:hypothetical protein
MNILKLNKLIYIRLKINLNFKNMQERDFNFDNQFNEGGLAPNDPAANENVGRDNIFWGNRRTFGDDDRFYQQ